MTGYQRRKQPEAVRATLVEEAARIIATHGLHRLTVDAVAKASGVTKGGLFHHFSTKQHLVRGVQDAIIAFADETIEAAMAADPEPHGRFTRAYLNGLFADHRLGGITLSRTLCLALLADPELQESWSQWVERRVAIHAATDDNPACALVRLAADGAWLNSLRYTDRPPSLARDVYDALIALTRPD